MMVPRKAKTTKNAERASPAMTVRGNATHHECAAAMASRCPATAKRAMVLKNDQKPFDTCSAPHPEGYIMITLDNLSEFQFTPPKFSPISPGHDLAQAEAFISPQQEARHTPPITDYVRIDISRDLEVLTEEDAF